MKFQENSRSSRFSRNPNNPVLIKNVYFENQEGGTLNDAVKVLNLTDIWHFESFKEGPLQTQFWMSPNLKMN